MNPVHLSERNRELAFFDQADREVAAKLGTIPSRWGRMCASSRGLLLELADFLEGRGLWRPGERFDRQGVDCGLIGVCRYGSLNTDLAFQASVDQGFASPALFGYTLPNIPLAEAAAHFGITGPVYSIVGSERLETAKDEAVHLLEDDPNLSFMLVCSLEHYPEGPEGLALSLELVKNDG